MPSVIAALLSRSRGISPYSSSTAHVTLTMGKELIAIYVGATEMNSAEFKMIRRLLGITTDDVAATFGVALRSARRWESSHQPPEGVAEWLQQKLSDARNTANEMLEQIEAENAANPDHVATLPMYRTDEEAKNALGNDTTKEQHAAIMGLVAFMANEEFDIRAEYATEN